MPYKFAKYLLVIFVLIICLVSVIFSQTKQQNPIEFIESKQFDLKGCVQMFRQKQIVLKDKASYLKNIRNDAQTQQCIENSKTLDFDRHSLIGMQINSGYCKRPLGFTHKVIKDNSKKQYVLTVSYIDPGGQVCRALSRYDLWLQVPKLQNDYEVIFKIEPKPRNSEN